MSVWDGVERRKLPRNGSNDDQVHTLLAQEIREHRDEHREEMRQIKHDITCLSTSVQKYQPLLDAMLSTRDARGILLRAVMKNTMSALVWACLLLIGYSIWQFVKQAMKG